MAESQILGLSIKNGNAKRHFPSIIPQADHSLQALRNGS
jgi:hypothetical protein